MSIEVLGCFEEFYYGCDEFSDEGSVFVCGNEIGLQRRKGSSVSVDFEHVRKWSYVLLYFIEGIQRRVKADDTRPYTSICSVDEFIPYDIADPSKSFGECAPSIGHYPSILLQNVEQDEGIYYIPRLS